MVSSLVLLMTLVSSSALEGDYTVFEVSGILARKALPGHLSSDGLTLYFSMEAEDGMEKVYYVKRRSLKAPWKKPVLQPGMINRYQSIQDTIKNSMIINNSHPTITDNRLRLVYVRNHTDKWEGNDLWFATRSAKKNPFDDVQSLSELNTDSSSESYPFLSRDGARLYYTANDRIVVSEFNNTSGLFERPDTLELPIDEPIVSCFLSRDENTILLTGYSSNILQLKRTSLNSPFEVIDSLILPDSIGYFSSPSLSDNGELYLYASISEDFYDRLMASDLNDWDSKARKKKNEPVPELFPEGVETAGIILILERRGD